MADNNPERQRDEAWRQLENAITMRSSQDQVLWMIFGAFSAANAILLVALFQTGDFPKHGVGRAVSIFGVIISITWILIQLRALGHVTRHEELIKRLDRELTGGQENEHSLYFEQDFRRSLPSTPSARHVMDVSVLILLVAWLALSLFFWLTP